MFKMPNDLKRFYETNYKILHRKLKKKGFLSDQSDILYKKIIFISNLEDLRKWTDQVLTVLDREEKSKAIQAQNKG